MFSLQAIELQSAPGKGSRIRPLRDPPSSAAEAELLRLASAEARARRDLGRAAARFLSVRGHQRLGFARIGDYARERLGISGRELQSCAAVAAKLGELALLAGAFSRGEIGWSQTRLLCAVAGAGSEAAWLARARGLTVRELVAEIRGSVAPHAAAEVAGAVEEASDSTDGEPSARFSLPCPARITVLWRRAIELARRMLGTEAPVWQAAEAIVAEASSSAEVEVSEGASSSASAVSLVPKISGLAARPPVDEDDLDLAPEWHSLDAFELDAEMLALVGALHSADAALGAGLRRFLDLRLYRAVGFASFDAYCCERIGISPAKARSLIALERAAGEAEAFGAAYRSGALPCSKALAILPVVRDGHASAWVRRAQEVTVRRLGDEVAWALDAHDTAGRPATPPEVDVGLEASDLQICARSTNEVADRRVTFFGPSSVVELFRAGVDGLGEATEPAWKGLERLLLLALATWEAIPRHRDPVFARDRWRCSVPGCSSRRSLEDHHIEFRSHGGGNDQANRVAICASHHHHAVHLGRVRVVGRAPDDLVWQLGLRPGRAPLLVFHGERYAGPSAL